MYLAETFHPLFRRGLHFGRAFLFLRQPGVVSVAHPFHSVKEYIQSLCRLRLSRLLLELRL